MKISVIIPTYNEATTIEETLHHLFSLHQPDEVIVCDGGSTDNTLELIDSRAKVIQTRKGRAHQLNQGVFAATGDLFVFLHADTQLPIGGLTEIRDAIFSGRSAGRFRMQFDERDLSLRIFEAYTRFHCFSYGDQCFFVKRSTFERLGGFNSEVPFEDIDFYKRLRKKENPVILKSHVVTSARRFKQMGSLRQKFINLWLVGLYYMGFNVFKMKDHLYADVR